MPAAPIRAPAQEELVEAGGRLWVVGIVGLSMVVAAAVVAPVVGGGWLFLLDWVIGPHSSTPRAAWGLDGGVTNGLVLTLLTLRLRDAVGAAATWLPFVAFFPIAGVGAARLAGASRASQAGAALLYMVNPVVFERSFVGHFPYLIGYALFPWVVRSVVKASAGPRWQRLQPALWIGTSAAMGPHFAWIAAIPVVAATVIRRPTPKLVLWLVALAGSVTLVSCYMVVLPLGSAPSFRVGAQDLGAYRTAGAGVVEQMVNLVGLYGFWRPGPVLPKSLFVGWPFVLVALLVVVGVGLRDGLVDRHKRVVAQTLACCLVFGLPLSMGGDGPTGAIFRWMFDNVPLFAVMREPQKFIALVALPYAVFFGWGARVVADGGPAGRRRALAVGLTLVLPIAYTPTLFGGLGGQLRTSDIPEAWRKADQVVGAGAGRVLVLPWHQYLDFPFTPHVIFNPADGLLRKEAIVGDNVELPGVRTTSTSGRSKYLEFLFDRGPSLCSFGQLVAPLDVQYVILARTVDFADFEWLAKQRDLRAVVHEPQLVVYENLRWNGGAFHGLAVSVKNWGDLVSRANRGEATAPAIAEVEGPGAIAEGCAPLPPPVSPASPAKRTSPVEYDIRPGLPGLVTIPDPFHESWRVGSSRPRSVAGGVMGFDTTGSGADAEFTHWRLVQMTYGVAAGATVLLFTFTTADVRRARRRARPPAACPVKGCP